jgi:hypothetical protein
MKIKYNIKKYWQACNRVSTSGLKNCVLIDQHVCFPMEGNNLVLSTVLVLYDAINRNKVAFYGEFADFTNFIFTFDR